MGGHHLARDVLLALIVQGAENQSAAEQGADQERCCQGGPRSRPRSRLVHFRATDTCHDAAAEIVGRHILGKARTQAIAQRPARIDLCSQLRYLGQALLEASGLDGPKLAVEIGVENELVLLGDAHRALSRKVAKINLRARARRDITVPIGTWMISAMER